MGSMAEADDGVTEAYFSSATLLLCSHTTHDDEPDLAVTCCYVISTRHYFQWFTIQFQRLWNTLFIISLSVSLLYYFCRYPYPADGEARFWQRPRMVLSSYNSSSTRSDTMCNSPRRMQTPILTLAFCCKCFYCRHLDHPSKSMQETRLRHGVCHAVIFPGLYSWCKSPQER